MSPIAATFFVSLETFYPFFLVWVMHLPARPSVRLYLRPSFRFRVHPSVSPSVPHSVSPSARLFLRPSVRFFRLFLRFLTVVRAELCRIIPRSRNSR